MAATVPFRVSLGGCIPLVGNVSPWGRKHEIMQRHFTSAAFHPKVSRFAFKKEQFIVSNVSVNDVKSTVRQKQDVFAFS